MRALARRCADIFGGRRRRCLYHPYPALGSNYSTQLRRTIHGGFSNYTYYEDLRYTKRLSPSAQATFARWEQQSARMQDRTESVLRAAITQDVSGFHEGLERLQPGRGKKGKMLTTVYLCKAAYFIYLLKHPDVDGVPRNLRESAEARHPMTLNWGPQFSDRFPQGDAEVLWKRFETLDTRLQADAEHFASSFQSGQMRYYFNEMPTELDVDGFTAGWNG